ncbi:flagellar hook-length control protein FliK [Stenotrophomonas maltophilia]|uniref:flagellar hook-length control protein FliK n=1 Tax=Stenotrophomonas maltophilia TaxID=40324 RepID=UPI003CF68C27
MPAPLASSANAQAQNTGNGSTRAPRNDSGKGFGQLLQDGTSGPDTSTAARTSSPSSTTPMPSATSDGNGRTPAEHKPGSDAATEDATASAPAGTTTAGAEKGKAAATEGAPWPPLGLAGLVLAVPTLADPAAVPATTATPVLADDAGALPAAAGAALPAAAATAPTAIATGSPDGKPLAPSADDATTLPLPEMILPAGKRGDRGEGSDVAAIGDRTPAPLLHAPATAAVQDLKAALATGNAIFNGEPTPKPVLGDDGFDQAIGARLGWLADQKIGHAHIRLSPDDMGPVDVRLQLNGDKVHASFSSPHVDVRQALESSLPRLRELLGEQGFQLAHADVGHQAPGGDGNASGQAGSGGMAGDGEPSPGDASVSSAQLIRQRGLLDAYA